MQQFVLEGLRSGEFGEGDQEGVVREVVKRALGKRGIGAESEGLVGVRIPTAVVETGVGFLAENVRGRVVVEEPEVERRRGGRG